MRIGRLAKESGESLATLRHWTKLGLLEIASKTMSGYALDDTDSVDKIKKLRSLQAEGKTLEDIGKMLGKDE
jgi:DNA-binding transcriptional MerR regulator